MEMALGSVHRREAWNRGEEAGEGTIRVCRAGLKQANVRGRIQGIALPNVQCRRWSTSRSGEGHRQLGRACGGCVKGTVGMVDAVPAAWREDGHVQRVFPLLGWTDP